MHELTWFFPFLDPSDYIATTAVLTFSNLLTLNIVDIAIQDDNLIEIDEVFNARLELVNAEDAQGVIFYHQNTTVIILDDDGR